MATLRALECFVAVLDHGSFSQAARRLYLSQPALSHHLGALERELGTRLLERHPAGARATAAGRAVAADARAAVEAARRVVDRGRDAAAGRAGRLRVGCAESMTGPLVAPVARAWRDERPGVALDVVEASSADALARALDAGEIDVAVGPRASYAAGAVHVVGQEEVLLVCAADHPLATAGTLGLAAVAGHGVVHYATGNGLAAWLDRLFAGHGLFVEPVTRVRHATSAAELAAAGLGVALVPRTAIPAGIDAATRSLEPRITRDVLATVGRADDGLALAFARALVARGLPGAPAEAS
ncbi:LysR family transcriptional regulator [Cellulosimicrobium cellulans]|uniref:LysR family transcriptional regulator n=1 Tax=Cellulosimicrobium cellulans TaxID=1710 RepID=UPI0008485CF8|nr:LysR family transcriptional regulator [Cellulosimicrobium cellulans]